VASPEWVLAGIRPAGAQLFVDDGMPTVRGVYYYECFVLDAVGNVGPPALTTDRATNYWLGDVYPPPRGDGYVDVADVTRLGAAFWSDPWDFEYDEEVDVGPTDDASGTGIPLTDDEIDFEDLFIFAMNYTVVTPYKDAPPPAGTPVLAWSQLDDRTWSLALAAPCPTLKGLRLRAALRADAAPEIVPGDLLASQEQPVFLRARNRSGLEAVLAVLGRGIGLAGSGELFRVRLPVEARPGPPAVEARDLANGELECVLGAAQQPELPTAFLMDQNSPNPFNPRTTIAFDLPEAQRVRLTVYAVDGRRVATLLDERRGPGRHEVVWSGRDAHGRAVASGTYFCRLEAGPYGKTCKMLLTK
jgi:hypothetical protein